VSFFSKLFKRAPVAPTTADPLTQEPRPIPPAPPDDIALLGRVGEVGGPDEPTAARLLASALASPRQRDAIDAMAHAMSDRNVPERLRLACAHALVQRGDCRQALAFLEHVSETPSLLLKADLLHDQGQVAVAVSVIERVLARNIDTPGARERHQRWRALVAPQTQQPQGRHDVTVAVPTTQQTPFRIVREVARGGAGTVYEARDDVLGRPLALKVYHKTSEREQIRREAQVAVELAGAGVIRVHDVDLEAGWVALEWLPRGSVRDVLRDANASGLGDPEAFVRGLVRALARVHARGWVHADVKPANILVGSSGEPLLSDFGIAVRAGEASRGGSAGYLSPERLAGLALCPADDVYGFGRILEDAVRTGHPAWQPWLPLAERCMAVRETRPEDGRAVLGVLG
jgi:serine/threonine-protein kinase